MVLMASFFLCIKMTLLFFYKRLFLVTVVSIPSFKCHLKSFRCCMRVWLGASRTCMILYKSLPHVGLQYDLIDLLSNCPRSDP